MSPVLIVLQNGPTFARDKYRMIVLPKNLIYFYSNITV